MMQMFNDKSLMTHNDNTATRQTICVVCIGAGAGECMLVPIGLAVMVQDSV